MSSDSNKSEVPYFEDKLPPELRLEIYKYLLVRQLHQDLLFNHVVPIGLLEKKY
jgi:hypothetical protein